MQFIRRLFIAAMLVCGAAGSDAMSQEQPNIIVILADDLGYSDLGCYGGEINTPNIDALAGGGVKLTQVYNSARCCPSRAALMTGLYPTQAGIGDFTRRKPDSKRGPGYLGRLRDDCVTMAEVLKPAGYGCYYVGKWHLHNETGPIKRGFDDFYGYTFDHSHDQYDADFYTRLPAGKEKEIDPPADEFYATDVFNDYAIEFIKQGQQTDKPWFLFLGHSSPHFPVQAPAERADKYEEIYLRGWDVLREERFERMQQLGLIDGQDWKMPPREIVPVDRDDIANDFSGEQNPAWDSLEADRQRDLARRMAVFAAMVEGVDTGVGQITEHLKQTGDLENTLIVFLSDNGACYEWGPFGFDGKSRRGETILRTGNDVRNIGGRGTHQSYGSAWANLGNTPFRMYKHFTHEGGISTPFIAHWPKGIGKQEGWVRDPAHMMDVLPTLMEAAGAEYPKQFAGNEIQPMEGRSLLPAMRGKQLPQREIGFDHQAAHAFRDGDWKIVYSKRTPEALKWELYNLANDRCELNDLADKHPRRLASMVARWEQWGTRVGVTWEPYQSQTADVAPANAKPESPEIANSSLKLHAEAESAKPNGVVIAQGGQAHGYALHFIDGRPAFDVRIHGKVTRLLSTARVGGTMTLDASLTREKMTLSVNGGEPISIDSPGLIPVQPVDTLSIGFDESSPAGDYDSPNRFNGKVLKHSVDAIAVKTKTAQDGKPFQSELITQWGAKVTADNAWTEYPRPQLKRDNWMNLNGHWDYAITAGKVTDVPTQWQGKILVPFAIEAPLSGVGRLLEPDEALWYRRNFSLQQKPEGRLLLHFEAVDYRSEVWVNGKEVGGHVGGNLPFSFDITEHVKAGKNTIALKVVDRTSVADSFQLRGKQKLVNRGIFYTRVSGIWQSVWLEPVPKNYIKSLKVDTKMNGEIRIEPSLVGNGKIRTEAWLDGVKVAEGSMVVKVDQPKLWSPDSPTLYQLKVFMQDESGNELDRVESYAGIREVGKAKDKDGHWRFTLNGKPIFHWGPLDQGWWPDGLLTPPSEDAMLFEINFLKQAGFNMIRKHIKVEPRLYYYHCDRLGMLVWQDQVSGGTNPNWYRLDPTKNKKHRSPEPGDPIDAEWPDADHEQWMAELKGMIDHLYNYPSIVMWVPFNEAWGQHRTMEVGEWIMKYDPSRSINIASGGNFAPVGDIADMHSYPHPEFPFHMNEYDDYIKVVGEFGGHGWKVGGHEWDPKKKNFIYGDMPKTIGEYAERYAESIRLLGELKTQGISGGVYTQTTDVEGEINGLMTYDRKVIKITAEDLATLQSENGLLGHGTPPAVAKVMPSIKAAFASVQRDGKPYKTFYNNFIAPHAILEKGIVFTAHQDGKGRPIVDAYDIKKKTWIGPVRASNFGLGGDTHGNPSITIDAKGHLHVFFGCHGKAMKHVRSAAPYDISQWEEMPSPTPRATYSQSMRMADGSIYLFYRAGGHLAPWSLRVSKDDGQSWSKQEPIIEMRRDFPDKKACSYNAFVPGADYKTVHCFWVYKDDNPSGNKRKYQGMHEAVYRYNMYYAKRTAEGRWIAADGTPMSDLPVNKTFSDKHAMILDSGEEFTAPTRIVIGEDDAPYINIRQGVTDWKSGTLSKVIVPYEYKFASPVDGKWQVHGEMPARWPDLVKELLSSAGPAAFGGEQPNKWFIHYEEGPPEDATATYVWLGHNEKGYAIRQDGSAKSDLAAIQSENGLLGHLSSDGQIPTKTSSTVKMNPIYQEVHPAPDIAGSSLQIVVEASQKNSVADGVLLAHGGNVTGYSLHVEQGIPVFEVTRKKEIFRVAWPEPVKGKMRVVADLGENEMSLSVNGEPKVSATSPGLLRAQPKLGLSVGYDARSNAGSYEVPNPYTGTILSTRIDAGGTPPAVAKVMPRSEIEAGLASHDKALFIKEGWIRDPYIILGPDDYYYLTGTTPNPGDSREQSDPYNTGLGNESIVGWKAQIWRSTDLINWESLGTPFTLKEGIWFEKRAKRFEEVPEKLWFLWAPEVHWLGDRWALTHTSPSPVRGANLALTEGAELKGPWTHPMGADIGHRHDPSLFKDDDGIWYLLYGNTEVTPLSADFSKTTAEPIQIDPSGSRTTPAGDTLSVIGHEGATMRKIGDKYVHMGTAWSTDTGRKGSYNLYYCTADKITGPYGERKFIGRFLGHGTPFQDKQGRWWCTAFYNGNIPPVGRKGIEKRDLSATAQTINQRGVTIVPLDVKVLEDGAIYIRAKDPAYANPGPDEVQQFAK